MNVIVFASRKGGSRARVPCRPSRRPNPQANKAGSAHRRRPAGLVDARHASCAAPTNADQNRQPQRHRHPGAAAKRDGIEWVIMRPPAEAAGRGRRRHQERHHGPSSRPARRVRHQRGAGNHSELPRGAQAVCGRAQRRTQAKRKGTESPIVTIARETLAKFRAPVWGGQITNRADLLIALGQGEAPANITMPKAAQLRRSTGCGPRSNARSRRSAATRVVQRSDAQSDGCERVGLEMGRQQDHAVGAASAHRDIARPRRSGPRKPAGQPQQLDRRRAIGAAVLHADDILMFGQRQQHLVGKVHRRAVGNVVEHDR